jgi:HSP20 family protein
MYCKNRECGTNSTQGQGQTVYVPPVRLYENENDYQLIAEIPGADDQSTEVTIDHGVLTLSAQMMAPQPEGAKLAYSEFTDGCYRRTFTLSDAVDPQGIEASVAKGVLTVRLPKSRNALPHKVRVVAG